MFEVELHNVLRLRLAIAQLGGLENETTYGSFAPPFRPVPRACWPPGPQLVEQRRPARILGETRCFRIQQHGLGHAEAAWPQRRSVVLQGDIDDVPDVRALDANTALSRIQRALQTLLVLLQPRKPLAGLVAKFTLRNAHAIGPSLGNGFSEPAGLIATDAPSGQRPLHLDAEDFARGAELFSYHLGLADERIQNAILFALVIEEVTTGDGLGGLQLAVYAAVPLFKTRRIPGQIDMDEVVTAGLQVEAFARGISADQDADGFLIERRIESDLDAVAPPSWFGP